VKNYVNHKENERREEGLSMHRSHVEGKGNGCGFLVRE